VWPDGANELAERTYGDHHKHREEREQSADGENNREPHADEPLGLFGNLLVGERRFETSSLDPGTVRLLEGPELMLRHHRDGRQNHGAILAPLETESVLPANRLPKEIWPLLPTTLISTRSDTASA
jgi:hypothetical protein